MSERKTKALALPVALALVTLALAITASAKTTTPKPKPTPIAKATTWTAAQIQSLITKTLDAYLAVGKFIGPPGPQGPQGQAGAIVSTYPANPSANSNGGSIAGFSQLSASNLTVDQMTTTKTLNVAQAITTNGLSVSGNTTTAGLTISGLTNLNCLGTNGAGLVGAGTCGGSSQWTTSGNDIFYNSGNVEIGATVPGGAPSGSLAIGGNYYGNASSGRLADFLPTRVSSTRLSFGSICTSTSTCNWVFSNTFDGIAAGSIRGAVTLDVAPGFGAGNYVQVYLASDGKVHIESDQGGGTTPDVTKLTCTPTMGDQCVVDALNQSRATGIIIFVWTTTVDGVWDLSEEPGVTTGFANGGLVITNNQDDGPGAAGYGGAVLNFQPGTNTTWAISNDPTATTVRAHVDVSLTPSFTTVKLGPTTVGGLGTCNGGAEGTMSAVNNSTTNTWGATITGGGSNHVMAYCDGTNWTVMAK